MTDPPRKIVWFHRVFTSCFVNKSLRGNKETPTKRMHLTPCRNGTRANWILDREGLPEGDTGRLALDGNAHALQTPGWYGLCMIDTRTPLSNGCFSF
ncbi:Hypothetical protein NTJ_07701 [Nesidiocoris tenuis]|uniref:Uncharacterized protein n=1 Tax=Nesidiocoris tenuis TaxID=355587 RepID=A0ABN7AU55_9HEMI|nr:Hypothetical protein NTJ_07701 [Nesidiocoris tenuis]